MISVQFNIFRSLLISTTVKQGLTRKQRNLNSSNISSPIVFVKGFKRFNIGSYANKKRHYTYHTNVYIQIEGLLVVAHKWCNWCMWNDVWFKIINLTGECGKDFSPFTRGLFNLLWKTVLRTRYRLGMVPWSPLPGTNCGCMSQEVWHDKEPSIVTDYTHRAKINFYVLFR